MSKIAIFGCSWTQGLYYEKYDSWPFRLSERYPQHEFFNCAVAGSSIAYHTYLLEGAKNSINPDFTIFQITSPYRFTQWKEHNPIDLLKKRTDNFMQIKDEQKFTDSFNLGTIYSNKFIKSDKKKHLFGLEYYNRVGDKQAELEFNVYIEYIKNRTDYCFFHRKSIDPELPSVYNVLGEEKFKKYIIDDGDHFGAEGLEWQSKWIEDILIKKGIL